MLDWNDLTNCCEGIFPFATNCIVIVRSSTVRRNGETLVQEQLPQEMQVSWYCSWYRPVPRASSNWHQHTCHPKQKLAFLSAPSPTSCVDWIVLNVFAQQSRKTWITGRNRGCPCCRWSRIWLILFLSISLPLELNWLLWIPSSLEKRNESKTWKRYLH